MAVDNTLYEVLGLSPSVSAQVIRAAYRCLAQQHHPDKHAGATGANERLVQINHAYAVLSDPVRREAYDRTWQRDSGFVERRGAGGGPGRSGGAAAVGPHLSRPFVFRPL